MGIYHQLSLLELPIATLGHSLPFNCDLSSATHCLSLDAALQVVQRLYRLRIHIHVGVVLILQRHS